MQVFKSNGKCEYALNFDGQLEPEEVKTVADAIAARFDGTAMLRIYNRNNIVQFEIFHGECPGEEIVEYAELVANRIVSNQTVMV